MQIAEKIECLRKNNIEITPQNFQHNQLKDENNHIEMIKVKGR